MAAVSRWETLAWEGLQTEERVDVSDDVTEGVKGQRGEGFVCEVGRRMWRLGPNTKGCVREGPPSDTCRTPRHSGGHPVTLHAIEPPGFAITSQRQL